MGFPSDKVALTRVAELIGDEDLYQDWALNLILAALVDTSFLGERGNKPPLTNDDVMKLVVSGISEDVIVRIIEMYEGDYEISCNALFRLRNSGVGDKTLEAIVLKALLSKSVDKERQ